VAIETIAVLSITGGRVSFVARRTRRVESVRDAAVQCHVQQVDDAGVVSFRAMCKERKVSTLLDDEAEL
jgi:hypothetical protein